MKSSVEKRLSNLETRLFSKKKRVLGIGDLLQGAMRAHNRRLDPDLDPNEEEELDGEWSDGMKDIIDLLEKSAQQRRKGEQNDTR